MKLILCDTNESIITAWKHHFQNYENIQIYHGSIFDNPCDALVSPANSFGFMDGGLDAAISNYFGWHVQDRVQEIIKKKHFGELLIGQAEIVETDDFKIPFVIAAPTMRVPMILKNTPNVYLAMRAVLLLVKYGKLEDGKAIQNYVKTIAVSGLGTGIGQVSSEICARQMKIACDEVILEKGSFPDSWTDAQERHQLLYSDNPRDLQYFGEND